ncbi:hypothetical protein J6I75_04830 [Pseudidiomarina sp. 1APP75-27a]|uniref:hypothetical protein n=1 Tax=Pseudidiomarina terrestris TaxID=2820060 RepID=UPI002B05C89E|nr:hypothetical protein [Pseudidiomarina sp. 1APP75-27a]MEA3587669.1 hypothetical protein [Pseudidiomarina sp. 1APP75-27a]
MNDLYKYRLYLTAFVLTFVSFSPLIEVEVKFFIYAIFLALNLTLRPKKGASVLPVLVFIGILLIGFVRDIWLSGSSSQTSFVGLYFLTCALFALTSYMAFTRKELVRAVERILFLGAILSLVGVIIYLLAPNLIYLFPDYINRGFNHKTIGITNFLLIDAGPVKRNTGFASEPGMWQFLMNVGLLFHFFLLKYRYSFFKVCVYCLALVSTVSTAGVLTFALTLLVAFHFFNKRHKLFFVVSILLAIPLLLAVISYHLQYKLNPDVEGFRARLEPAVNIISEHVSILGRGNVFYDANVDRYDIGSFDSYTQLTIRYGLLGLFAFVACIVFGRIRHSWIRIPIVITAFSQAIWFYPITFFILMISMGAKDYDER